MAKEEVVPLTEEEYYARGIRVDYQTYLNDFWKMYVKQNPNIKNGLTTDEARKDKFYDSNAQKTSTLVTNQPSTTPTTNGGYTMQDVVSVDQTGKLPKVEEQPKSVYDTYMEEARDIYNKEVEENNKAAANQAAMAGAQYREINRNINELNKANGRANTGYAGDTSIDAYNAYRNSVNESYFNANKTNNDLYSYYLSEVANLQQAKANEEYQNKQIEWQEREYSDTRETNAMNEIVGMLNEEGAYNADGTINSNTASKIYEFAKAYNGGKVPETTLAYLNTINGFSDWLDAYNSGNTSENNAYKDEHENQLKVYGLPTEEGYRGANNTAGKVNVQGFGTTDRPRNDIDLSIGGVEYDLRMGDLASDTESRVLDRMFRDKQPKMTAVYNGYIFIVDHSGNWRKMWGDKNTINEAVDAYIKAYQGK